MHALDPRTVNPDFAERARQRHVIDAARFDLEGYIGFRLAELVHLEEVGAQRGIEHVEKAPQNPVLVGTGDSFQFFQVRLAHPVRIELFLFARLGLRLRVEGRVEQGDQQFREARVPRDGLFHIGL